ncbi:exocyst complex component exo84 [Knufia obscura]|uniref:Exocyst complex component EXO84 n=2 Tax=Knufia TaxID=430999 RepID=A0AAN8EWS8_9EURO|nr:exocyst complex component exo84 [Knufia obscura]KAK5955396.1 exocyst complex component exo84 [Knufia fluminis]
MSEGRGLTLRKKKTQKRPVISAPQQQRPEATKVPSNAQFRPTKERPVQSETSDLVKRRYSTRYNQLPQFGSDIPDVPSLPGAGANNFKRRSHGSPARPQSSHSSHPLRIDQLALSDPALQHERYVAQLLSNASEEDIQEYQHNLNRIKRRNSMDLKQSVYQNRTQFIRISKEAESLKSEMSNLRTLMTELTTALEQSSAAAGTNINTSDGSLKRRNANRSSVANLEAMWNTQLQALWKNVEKSQKFLPAIPGRHVVMENPNWIELDSATWKPRRPVHIVLLNDHLLVASKKRKKLDPNLQSQGPAPTKLVAEECWPLTDIDVVDMAAGQMKDEKAVASAITIRSAGKTWTYRHEKRDNSVKNDVLTNIRKAQEDLRKANLPKTDQTTAMSELNYFASRDPSSAKNGEIMDTINSSKEKPDILIEVDGKQQNFRWIEAQIDDLDIDIALQHTQTAVDNVEKLRAIAKNLKNNSIAQDLISVKVDERAAKLASVLSRDLTDKPSFVESTKSTTNLLIRLGFEDRAREVYLAARGDTLTKRQRQCVFDGDLHKYIFSISYVYFTIIKNTVLIFQASFPPSTMSACISWTYGHLEVFNALLVRQLSAVEREGKVWRDCMDVVWGHEREMLGEVGLDFREVIGRGLEWNHGGGEGVGSRSRSREGMRAA